MAIALLPLMKPTTCGTEYLGGTRSACAHSLIPNALYALWVMGYGLWVMGIPISCTLSAKPNPPAVSPNVPGVPYKGFSSYIWVSKPHGTYIPILYALNFLTDSSFVFSIF
jgi:hypothetical protein